MALQRHYFGLQHQAGKLNVVADELSRMPNPDDVKMLEDRAGPKAPDSINEPDSGPHFTGLAHAETESIEPMVKSEEERLTLLPDALLGRFQSESVKKRGGHSNLVKWGTANSRGEEIYSPDDTSSRTSWWSRSTCL